MKARALIIKSGNSEVFNEMTSSEIVSLGDVVRCFYLVNYLNEYSITWYTSKESVILFKEFLPKTNIETEIEKLSIDEFDLIINLEKDSKILGLIQNHKNILGFTQCENILFISFKSGNKIKFEEALIELSHSHSSFETKLNRILGFTKKINNINKNNIVGKKIGLNWKVGNKWPEKSLGNNFWNELESELKKIGFEISWQKGFEDLRKYIDWINSCDYLITLDSLGLHLSAKLEKPTIVLFGPTNPHHIEDSELIKKIHHDQNDHFYFKKKILLYFNEVKYHNSLEVCF